MGEAALAITTAERVIRRRTRRDPKARFKPDVSGQFDAVCGCPQWQVPVGHLARTVASTVAQFDYGEVEQQYSSLGRHGYQPRHVVGVLVYGMLIGIHHSTKLGEALKTDAAFRLLAGGYAISAGTLRRFRRENLEFFLGAISRTVALAQEAGLLRPDELAVDSMRLRAHASTKAVRTVSRSTRRLEELRRLETSAMTAEEREVHDAKVKKHEDALTACAATGRSSVVLTNPSAALMKFPDAGGLPGHRITVTAAGVRERIVVGVLVDAATNDCGKLEQAVRSAREGLLRAGVPEGTKLQVAADAGYYSHPDLLFAEQNRAWVDVLIAGESARGDEGDAPVKYFGRDQFKVLDDGSAICPAGKPMRGPIAQPGGRVRWRGRGCDKCPMHDRCTPGRERSLVAHPELERVRTAMAERMSRPDAERRYQQRMATVEPVFSNIESTFGFRRASSRLEPSVVAQILVAILAHNISRLGARRKVLLVLVALG